MRYLPTFCDACGRAALALLKPGMVTRCPNCGEANRVVPGASYGMEDVQLFIDIAAVVFDARLTRPEASTMVEGLQRAAMGAEPPEVTFERLTRRMPGLEAVRLSLAPQPKRLVQAMGMLRTAVSARSHAPPRKDSSTSRPAIFPDVFAKVPGGKKRR